MFNQSKKAFFLAKTVPNWMASIHVNHNELEVETYGTDLLDVCTFLRDHSQCQYKTVVDITAVDYPAEDKRFQVVYNLLSVRYNARLRLLVRVDELQALPSLTQLFATSSWFEREVWDMFGIFFANHPDLRRILTDYGFEGHPLRKDYPLSGYVEARYDDSEKRVVTEQLELTQDFRYFDFSNPWEVLEKKVT